MDTQHFLTWLHQAIPLTEAMQVDQLNFDGCNLSISAPLIPNINDKGTGFAGATSGLLTLSGWALITLWLKSRGIEAEVMIAKSELIYVAPIKERFTAQVNLPESEVMAIFWQRFEERGRARLPLEAFLGDKKSPLLRLKGEYVAVRR